MVRVPTFGAEAGQSLSKTKDEVVAALQKGNIGGFKVAGTEIVGPTVGAELTSKGIWATVLSLIGILIYLAFRFQFSFGVGAVVATIHDLLITLAFLAFFRYDMSLNVIAAILTMTGLLDQRHDRHLRPDSRKPAVDAARFDGRRHQRVRQPDAGPDGHHVGHGAADGARPVLLRRRGAARVRVHDGRRDHHRNLLERVHRGGHGQLLARHGADAGGGACAEHAAPHSRRPRSSRRARTRRSAKCAPRKCPLSLQAAILGIVQGVTEFLPISSTAHLLIAERLLGFQDPGGVFTVMIQLGSIFAVVWLYRAKVLDVVTGLPSRSEARRFAFKVARWRRCRRWWPGALFSKFVTSVLYGSFMVDRGRRSSSAASSCWSSSGFGRRRDVVTSTACPPAGRSASVSARRSR